MSAFPNYWLRVVVATASIVALHCVWTVMLNCFRNKRRRKRNAAQEHFDCEGELLEMTKISETGFDSHNPWSARGENGGTGKAVVMEPPPLLPLASFRDKRDRTQLDLKFENLRVQALRSSDPILNRVSGRCRPGRITAIMVRHGKAHSTPLESLHFLTSCFFSLNRVHRAQARQLS
jgi:hypothetical protein